jgi:HSP20 family protein
MSLLPQRVFARTKRSNQPVSLLEDLQSDLNRFFDSSLFNLTKSPIWEGSLTDWIPSTDIFDAGDKVLIKMDLPGVEKKNIEVSVHGSSLSIRGEKKHEDKIQDMGCIRSERFIGQFERLIPLSNDLDAAKIDAAYENGVLTLTILKKEEVKAKQIKVDIK